MTLVIPTARLRLVLESTEAILGRIEAIRLCMRLIALVIGFGIAACASPAPADDRDRAAALAAAQDTVKNAWKHEVAVDSVQLRGDTTVVWVSPRNWMATDPPQAAVRVLPRGRVAAIEWIMGG